MKIAAAFALAVSLIPCAPVYAQSSAVGGTDAALEACRRGDAPAMERLRRVYRNCELGIDPDGILEQLMDIRLRISRSRGTY